MVNYKDLKKEKHGGIGIRTSHLSFHNCGDAHTFVLFQVLTFLQKFAPNGQFHYRKKTPTTELKIFFPKKFSDGK